MTTDTRADRPLTIADLCQAISEERIGYSRSDDSFEVSGLHLARYLRGEQPRPSIALPHVALDPATLESGCSA